MSFLLCCSLDFLSVNISNVAFSATDRSTDHASGRVHKHSNAGRSGGIFPDDDVGRQFLTRIESEIGHEINLARLDPKRYATFLEAYLERFEGNNYRTEGGALLETKEGRSAVVEAIEYLKNATPVPTLKVSRGLSWAAADHVRDQGPLGIVGHQGTSGSTPRERAQRYGEWKKFIAEISTFGYKDPRQIVMSFIVDDGVPDRGHREDLFDPKFQVMGISYGSHSRYQSMCVVNLAGGFMDKAWR